jgi:hypothetical protein
MRIFLAGIMQGSLVEAAVHEQDYRDHLKELLKAHLPEAEIYDPRAEHSNSIAYDDATGREVFLCHNRLCREVDVLLAFLPEASMGTAVEMWEAHQHGAAVVTISPMRHNWVVKFLTHALYATVEELEADLRNGTLRRRVEEVLKRRVRS